MYVQEHPADRFLRIKAAHTVSTRHELLPLKVSANLCEVTEREVALWSQPGARGYTQKVLSNLEDGSIDVMSLRLYSCKLSYDEYLEQRSKFRELVANNSAPDTGVYLILNPVREAVKVGYTTNLPERLRAISVHSPDPLEIVAYFPGDKHLEKELHTHLCSYHLKGEWFSARALDQLLPYPERISYKFPTLMLEMLKESERQEVLSKKKIRRVKELEWSFLMDFEGLSTYEKEIFLSTPKGLSPYILESIEKERQQADKLQEVKPRMESLVGDAKVNLDERIEGEVDLPQEPEDTKESEPVATNTLSDGTKVVEADDAEDLDSFLSTWEGA